MMKASTIAAVCVCMMAVGYGTAGAKPPSQSAVQGSKQGATQARVAVGQPNRVTGCDATVLLDLHRIAKAPGVEAQLAGLWQRALARAAKADEATEFLSDLARLGVDSPSVVESVELCLAESPSTRRGSDASERAGALIRGDFAPGAFLPLVMKWASADITGLWQHGGVDVVKVGKDVLFAQRRDGSLIIASHAGALHALIDAPSDSAMNGRTLAASARNFQDIVPRRSGRDLRLSGVRGLDFDLGPSLQHLRLAVWTRDEAAAIEVASLLREMRGELKPKRTPRGAGDTAGNAVVDALRHASISRSDHGVVVDARLPRMWAALVIGSAFEELR